MFCDNQTSPPSVDRLRSVQIRLEEAKRLSSRVSVYTEKKIEGSCKLLNKVKSEVRFLEKVYNGQIPFKESHILSTNLKSLQAIIEAADKVGVDCTSCLLRPFQYTRDSEESSVKVDVVGNGGRLWVKVIARKATALFAVWKGDGQFGEKTMVEIGQQYIDAASQHPVDFRIPTVVFAFSDRVPSCIARKLNELGIYIVGEVVSIADDSDGEEGTPCDPPVSSVSLSEVLSMTRRSSGNTTDVQSAKELDINSSKLTATSSSAARRKVNLDITAMLCLVSNLTNGMNSYEYGIPVLDQQAKDERTAPALPQLTEFLIDKELIACEAAVKNFKKIIATIGGRQETLRSTRLLDQIRVVGDSPSSRTLKLETSAKINERAKVIFGTGDAEKATTVTANVGFVRAAAQNGVQFSVFVHEARALTETKEREQTTRSNTNIFPARLDQGIVTS